MESARSLRGSIPRDLLLVCLSLLVWGLGEGMFTYFQALYLQQWGASPEIIGAILGGVGIAMTLAQTPAGWLADRLGPRPVMWASWILGFLSCLIMALSRSLTAFIVGMLLYGLTSFVVAPMNAYLAAVRGPWSVERALTIASASFQAGMIAGPLIGGLLAERSGIRTIYPIAAALFAVSTAMVLFARKPPVVEHTDHDLAGPHLFANRGFLWLLGLLFLTMFALYMPQPLTPNFLQDSAGLNLTAIGQLGAVGSLGNTFISLTLGALRGPVGFLVGQGLMVVAVLLFWRGDSLGWYAAAYFFMGGYRLARLMSLAYARTLVRSHEVGLAFGLIETANAISVILAPIVAGLLFGVSPRLMYAVAFGIILVVLSVNVIRLIRTTIPQKMEEMT